MVRKLRRSNRTFQQYQQTALLHLKNLALHVSPDFPKVVGIVKFAEIYLKYPFVLLRNVLIPEMTDIQPNVVG